MCEAAICGLACTLYHCLQAPNIPNSTISALNDTVAASANALAHIDEYKNDLDPKVIEFLKGLWNGT